MSELVRGQVTDRPWGLTLGALALRGLTGRLVLPNDGYTIAFREGAVVHALSKDPRDAAVRIAVTTSLVTPPHAAQIMKRIKGRDEIEAVIDLAKLSPEQADRLSRSVIAQRTARTFAIERGEFVVDNVLPDITKSAVDIRPIIYLGAHSHMTDDRLAIAVDDLGKWFRLKDEAKEDIQRFGFTDAELEVVTALTDGSTIIDLGNAHDRVHRRSLLAIVYTLASALALEISPTAPARGRLRTRGKASIPPPVEPTRMRSRVNSQVSFKKPSRKAVPMPAAEPDPEPMPAPTPMPEAMPESDPMFDLRSELEAELADAPPLAPPAAAPPEPPPPPPFVGRRTAQLIAFVAVPRAPAPVRPQTVDNAPLEQIDQAPAERASTPTPFGAIIPPRRPAK